jgi:hypothetical protein
MSRIAGTLRSQSPSSNLKKCAKPPHVVPIVHDGWRSVSLAHTSPFAIFTTTMDSEALVLQFNVCDRWKPVQPAYLRNASNQYMYIAKTQPFR